MGQSRMERFPKQWKHLQWRWTKAFLSVARVVRLCSTGLGSTCIKSCYYPIYCNPFAMSGLGFLLRSPCLTCTMGRSDGRKERFFVDEIVWLNGSTTSPRVSWGSSKNNPKHRWSSCSIPLLYIWAKALVEEPMVYLPCVFIGNNTAANIMSFRFHWGHNW